MTRRISKKSLKSVKPKWFCVANRFGSIADLAASGIKLQYVTDRNEIADIWRYLGNPKFRGEYAYLLVDFDDSRIEDVYAVRLPEGTEISRNDIRSGQFIAFEGEVDKICYGWASPQRAKSLMIGESTCGGNPRNALDEL
jgi:hypothetical protein